MNKLEKSRFEKTPVLKKIRIERAGAEKTYF